MTHFTSVIQFSSIIFCFISETEYYTLEVSISYDNNEITQQLKQKCKNMLSYILNSTVPSFFLKQPSQSRFSLCTSGKTGLMLASPNIGINKHVLPCLLDQANVSINFVVFSFFQFFDYSRRILLRSFWACPRTS